MISICIPIYNNLELTKECLKAIYDNTSGEYEVILIDNGSNPAFVCNWDKAVIIRNEENKGFPIAVNQGIQVATGDTIVLLNNDVIVTPNWLERLTKHLDEYDIVGPMTNYVAGHQKALLPVYENRKELDEQALIYYQEHKGETQEVNFVIGFCMVFRKDLWEELGPFDESIWPCSGEEIDFCLRALELKHRIGIVQDLYVHHIGSQTFSLMQKSGQINYGEICQINDAHLAEKWGADFWHKQVAL